MKITAIHYNQAFAEQFKRLPSTIQKKATTKEALFRSNPFHPSLRLHKLKGKLDGYWSISITLAYRIIFKVMEDGTILFISVGRHAIYEV